MRANPIDPAVILRLIGFASFKLKTKAMMVQSVGEVLELELDSAVRSILQTRSQEDSDLADKVKEYWSFMKDPCRELASLAWTIQVYASGYYPDGLPRADLKEAIERHIARLLPDCARINLQIDSTAIKAAHRPRMDDYFLGIAVEELIVNSSRAYKDQSGHRTVCVGTECKEEGEFPDGDYAEVYVADTAPPLSEARLRQALEGKANRAASDDFGFDSSLVRDIVTVHGGQFLEESVPGGKTTLRIRLPL